MHQLPRPTLFISPSAAMSAFAFVRLFALFGALVSSVAAAPIIDARNSVAKRSTFAAPAPHFTIYNDKWQEVLPTVAELAGYNVL